MTSLLTPASAEEAADYVASAAERSAPLELRGRGSKEALGRPLQ